MHRDLAIALTASLGGQAVVALMSLTPPVLAVAAAPDYGVRPSDIGWFTTALFLLAMCTAATGGSMVRRFGAIRVTQTCLAAAAAGMALLASADLALAVLGAVLIGIGYGPMTPASSHLLAPVTSRRNRPFVFSLKQTSIPVGGAVAGVVPAAIAAAHGWRTAVLAIALTGLAAALALQPIRRRFDADRDRHAPIEIGIIGPVREALADPALRRIVAMSVAFGAVQACFLAFFVTFLVEQAGIDLLAAGLLLTIGQVTAMGGRVFWGAIAERLVSTRVLLAVLGAIMAACCLAAALVAPGWPYWALVALGTVFGLTAVGWNGLYLAEIVRVTSPARSARATGATLFFTFGGMMLMPAVFSLVVAATGSWRAAFVLLALVPLPAALAMMRRTPPVAGPAPETAETR